ncbi:MAG: rod shape-determining protein MreC [Elusimicrobia bacterium]|nr:rod shape-determining protein MreC [Elusimicrobiota bacterium]
MHREARIANYALAVLSALSLILLSLHLSAPVQAFKACVTYVLNPVAYYGAKGSERFSNVPANVKDLLAADMENRLMREKIKQAQWVETESESLKVENQRLRAALGLKAPQLRSPTWAHVTERDPLHWYRSVMIDAGAGQGLTVNAPVLGTQGGRLVAVGRVVEVRANASIVLLLSDELSSVAAYAASPSTETPRSFEGLLQGQGNARLRMNYLIPDATIEKGDMVYTSPTSATFPPDVLIGTVTQIYPPDQELEWKSVAVAPAADASRLEEVLILKIQSEAAEAPKLSQTAPEPDSAQIPEAAP